MADNRLNKTGLAHVFGKIKAWVASQIAGIANPSESVTFNSNGQLDVGGRLGAFGGSTGIFHSKDRAPRNVSDYSFLITDALGMNMSAPRSFAIVTGQGLSLTKSHAAGSTSYTVVNNYANRIMCAGIKYLSLSEAESKVSQIVPVTSITIGGSAYTPDSAENDSSNPITITVAVSVNPNSAVTAVRGFSGILGGYCSEYIGNGTGGDAGGCCLVIGQSAFNKSGNMNVVIGQYIYNAGNGNAVFGRWHISRKNRWLLVGTGHDNTSGRNEAGAAVGQYSRIDGGTLFAVGNGTSHRERSNAFEVVNDGVVLNSPDGNRWKISVDNSGNVISTAL